MKRANVAILGAPPRFHSLLAHVLSQNCRARVVAAEQADICIIDLDGHGAGELLAAERRRQPPRPLILLSLREVEGEEGVWLKKPLQSRELAQALERILERQERPAPQRPSAGADLPEPRSPAGDVDPTADEAAFYEPRDYLQNLLVAAYRQALATEMTLRIDLGWEPIVIYPRQRLVWVDADDRKLRAFCRLPLHRVVRLRGEGGPQTVIQPDPQADLQKPPPGAQRMDAFLWKVAWWNAAGRLPRSVAPDRPLQLRQWPNLTRYWHPPQALPIAALLYRRAQTTLAAARVLRLPMAEVAGFVSAASALQLLRFPEVRAAAIEPVTEAPRVSERQGLFQRIMKRLRGK